MNVAKSSRAEAAEKAARMRAEAARKERQRRQVIAAVVAVAVVIGAVIVGVVVANQPRTPPTGGGGSTGSASADAALAKLVALPQATLDASAAPNTSQAPAKLQGGTALTADGCPRCSTSARSTARSAPWSAGHSSVPSRSSAPSPASSRRRAPPRTCTRTPRPGRSTARRSRATSLAFEAVETADREQKPLQPLEGENAAIFQKYNPSGGIPWITYGGTHATNGATVDANVLDGKSYDEIIAGIEDPSSDIGKTVNPAINMITAQLCEMTGGKPTDVCSSQAARSASVLIKR